MQQSGVAIFNTNEAATARKQVLSILRILCRPSALYPIEVDDCFDSL
jgi:hypothetical protein